MKFPTKSEVYTNSLTLLNRTALHSYIIWSLNFNIMFLDGLGLYVGEGVVSWNEIALSLKRSSRSVPSKYPTLS
jgi:hypothetical protein